MKLLVAALVLCGVHGSVLRYEDSVDVPRVIDGIVSAEGAWPSQLSLQRLREPPDGWGHTCGATLLNENWALTAAHCVTQNPIDRRIEAGVNIRHDPNGQLKFLSDVVMHEDYISGSGWPNDIAVVRFTTPVELNDRVQPGILPDPGEDFVNAECIISGWGRIDTSNDIPMDLREGPVSVITHEECVSRMGSNVIPSHICIFDRNAVHGACNGDSGGPINCRQSAAEPFKQVGVASWVRASGGNCLVSFPSVYGRVSSFLDWIADNTP